MKPSAFGRWTLDVGRWTFCLCLAACSPPAKPLPQLFQLPQFTLTERSGKPFDSSTLGGKVWVAGFFFAGCGGTCPMINAQLKKLHAAVPNARFISISVDEKDTPEVLRAYAGGYGADDRWYFVTGKKDDIFKLSVDSFKMALVEPEGVYAPEKFIHSSKLVLVDKAGWIRGYYDGVGETAEKEKERLIADIKRLQAQ